MAFPNLTCALNQSYSIGANAEVSVMTQANSTFRGIYVLTFSDDVHSNLTALENSCAGYVMLDVASTGQNFFVPIMPLGNVSTGAAGANTVTMTIEATEIKLKNTRATAAQVQICGYKYA